MTTTNLSELDAIEAPEDEEDNDGLFIMGWDEDEAALIKKVYKNENDIVVLTDKFMAPFFFTSLPKCGLISRTLFCRKSKALNNS